MQNPVTPNKEIQTAESEAKLKSEKDLAIVVVHNPTPTPAPVVSKKVENANLDTLKRFVKEIHQPEAVPEVIALKYLKQFDKDVKFIINTKQVQSFTPNLNIKSEKKLLSLFGITSTDAKNPTNLSDNLYFFHPYQYILALMINSITYSDLEKRIEFAFMMYDHDDDGMITKADLKEMLSVYGKEGQFRIDEKTIENMVEAIFANLHGAKSGENRITLSEFKEFFKNESFVPIKVDIFERRRASISFNGSGELANSSVISSNCSQPGPQVPPGPSSFRPDPNKDKQKPQKPSKVRLFFQSIKNKYYIDGAKRIWLTLFFLGLLYFSISTFVDYYSASDSVAVGIAKGAAALIKYCMVIMLALVTKTLTTILRKIGLAKLLPLNFHVYFHTILGMAVLIASWAHSIAHIGWIMRRFSNADCLYHLNILLNTPTYRVHSYSWWVFQSIPGWTGIVSLILITFLCILALKKLRKQNHERFKYSHALWVVIIIILCFHGCCEFLGSQGFYMWICFPTAVLVFERFYSWAILLCHGRHKILDLKYFDQEIIELKVSKPPGYTFIPGQYVDIKIPQLALLQWHPFSFSCSPKEDFLRFHISPVGDWTRGLKQLAINFQAKRVPVLPNIFIRGPFGAPSQHYSDFKNLMIIGTGVGATPFASILQDFSHKAKAATKIKKTKSVDFYWVNRKPTSNIWLNSLFKELLSHEEVKNFIRIHMFFTNPQQRYDLRSVLLWRGLEILHQNGVKINGLELFDLMHWGRPDWDEIFQNKIKEIKRGTVGVFFCGNNYVAKELHRKCLQYSGKVIFKFNKEIF